MSTNSLPIENFCILSLWEKLNFQCEKFSNLNESCLKYCFTSSIFKSKFLSLVTFLTLILSDFEKSKYFSKEVLVISLLSLQSLQKSLTLLSRSSSLSSLSTIVTILKNCLMAKSFPKWILISKSNNLYVDILWVCSWWNIFILLFSWI